MSQEWKQEANFLLLFLFSPSYAFCFSSLPLSAHPLPLLMWSAEPANRITPFPHVSMFPYVSLQSPATHPKDVLTFSWASSKCSDIESSLWLSSIAQPSTLVLLDGFALPGLDKPLRTQEMNEIIRKKGTSAARLLESGPSGRWEVLRLWLKWGNCG